MKIDCIIWIEKFVDKIQGKHNIKVEEVEEILSGNKKVFRIEKGHVKGENVYLALGRTNSGRYLSVFFILKAHKTILPISARDMDFRERKRYQDG